MSDRDPTFASFEPERLTPKGRRIDPIVVVAAIVVVGIAAAVLKPWGAESETPTASAAAAIVAPEAPSAVPAVPSPSASSGTDPRVVAEAVPPIAWPRAAAALIPHDTWGVRAIVIDPEPAPRAEGALPDPGLIERWVDAARGDDAVALLPTADEGVLALGLTFPPDELPLDARIYAATPDGGWSWLDAAPLEGAPASGAFLFAPPRRDGVPLPSWPTGAYRIEVLQGMATRTIDVALPDRFEVVPGPGELADRASGPSPFAPDFQLRSSDRAFVVQDGAAVPLDGGPSGPMDLATAWSDAGLTGGDRAIDLVPSIYAPRATGLGVMLPAGATAHTGTVTALAPVVGDPGSRRALGIRFWDGGRSPYVIFRGPRASTWAAGVYRMDVAWTQDGTRREAAYHVELLPGPAGDVPSGLAALRALAPAAGQAGIVGHTGSARDARSLACGATPSGESPSAIGVGYEPGTAPSSIGLELRLAENRDVAQPILVARDVVPGLSIVVPAAGDGFTPGVYEVTLGQGATGDVQLACLGADVPG